MAELHARRVEGNRVLRKLRRRRKEELGIGIDESLDQPRRRDAIDVRTRAGDPPPTAKLAEIERRPLFAAGRLRPSGAHGDGLLETPHFGAASGVEKVDVADALVVFGQASQLVTRARALRR